MTRAYSDIQDQESIKFLLSDDPPNLGLIEFFHARVYKIA